jgi:hypothetical protein
MRELLIILILGGVASKVTAQLSGNNLMEIQFGNIPDQEPKYLKTIYDQFNIQYQWKGVRVFSRLEQFYSTLPGSNDYTKLTQYSLNYNRKGWEVKLGNFYETIGRGLLLRGYEIKGSVFEDRIYRVRQGFYKDVRGAFARYGNSWFEAKVLHGKSLAGQLPPNHPDNRTDLVSAGELTFFVKNQRVGGIYLQNVNPAGISRYLDFHTGGNLSDCIDYYGELAHRLNGSSEYLAFSNNSSYGAYFSFNYSSTDLGVSLEWKDYHNFLIGSGLADPPSLVKEHSYKLLNRATHIGELLDERGIQLEVFYRLNEKSHLTLNHSRGKNNFLKTYRFHEYFAEWYADFTSVQMQTFFDYSFDEYKQEGKRIAGGFYFTRPLQRQWAVKLESEIQQIDRTDGSSGSFQNSYAGLIVSKSSQYSAALVWEFTNDPLAADFASTERLERKRHYLSINLSYKPSSKNSLQLFAGQRRGGPACTSGVCYEVLDFTGLELRWSTRF